MSISAQYSPQKISAHFQFHLLNLKVSIIQDLRQTIFFMIDMTWYYPHELSYTSCDQSEM